MRTMFSFDDYYNCSEEEAKRNARYHEAAHAVLAKLLFKGYITSLSISLFIGGKNIATTDLNIDVVGDRSKWEWWTEPNVAIIALAGICADRLILNVPWCKCKLLSDYMLLKTECTNTKDSYLKAYRLVKANIDEITELAKTLEVGQKTNLL